jgi:hypothetical protein
MIDLEFKFHRRHNHSNCEGEEQGVCSCIMIYELDLHVLFRHAQLLISRYIPHELSTFTTRYITQPPQGKFFIYSKTEDRAQSAITRDCPR